LLDACSEVDDALLDIEAPGTYGKPRDTLVHLVAAEGRYVARLRGETPDGSIHETKGWPGLDALKKRAAETGDALIELAGHYTPDWTLHGTWRAEPFTMKAIVPIMQAINHATEHRAHVMTALTQQGATMPDLDIWAYNSEVLSAR
jgi:uncharacterized damage-inducible protein DinB